MSRPFILKHDEALVFNVDCWGTFSSGSRQERQSAAYFIIEKTYCDFRVNTNRTFMIKQAANIFVQD